MADVLFSVQLVACPPVARGVAARSAQARLVRWRLVEPSGRVAGYGADEFPDAAVCRQAVHRLQRDILLRHRRVRPQAGHWQWEVRTGGSIVASSGRRFDREDSCQLALMSFIIHFEDAPVEDVVRVPAAGDFTAGAFTAGAERW